jgi:hypothetical protein
LVVFGRSASSETWAPKAQAPIDDGAIAARM